MCEPRAGARERRPAPRILGPRRRQQPSQRRAAGLAQEFVHRGRDGEFAAAGETVQQFGHEGMEAMGTDPARRFPHDGYRASLRQTVERGAARARVGRRAAGDSGATAGWGPCGGCPLG
jgi:hypothetical protein